MPPALRPLHRIPLISLTLRRSSRGREAEVDDDRRAHVGNHGGGRHEGAGDAADGGFHGANGGRNGGDRGAFLLGRGGGGVLMGVSHLVADLVHLRLDAHGGGEGEEVEHFGSGYWVLFAKKVSEESESIFCFRGETVGAKMRSSCCGVVNCSKFQSRMGRAIVCDITGQSHPIETRFLLIVIELTATTYRITGKNDTRQFHSIQHQT